MASLWNVLLVCLFCLAMSSAAEEATVDTTSGLVFGTHVPGTSVVKYLGIPYAEPPIGERRFKPPVKKARMNEIFNATANGFSCPQNSLKLLEDLFGKVSTNEDCLNLNIFAPVNKSEPLSVMVWVYGGGFVFGSASTYDATLLAELHDVIVVVMNYRIGILGFLSTMDDNSVGNFALRDQCLALQWVNENIEQFGGNRNSITLFGESAGSVLVSQLTMVASCEGLFHRVIAQSGSASASWSGNPDPLNSAKEVSSQLGCPTDKTSSIVQCLRGKTTDELLKCQLQDTEAMQPNRWVPSYASDFFSFVPKKLPVWKDIPIENKMNKFDFMAGLCMEEGEFLYEMLMAPLRENGKVRDKTDGLPISYLNQTLTNLAKGVLQGDSDRAEKLLPSFWFQYTDWHNPHSKFTNSKMLIELMGDITFHVSSVQFARLHAEFGGLKGADNSGGRKTYFYRLKHRGNMVPPSPWSVGATHGDDVGFVFGFLLSGLINATAEEIHLSRAIMEYWTNFAKTGNPNEPSKLFTDTVWPTFSLLAEEYIELDVNMTRDSTAEHPYATRVAFWEKFIPEQVKIIMNEMGQEPRVTETTSTTENANTHGEL